MFFIYYLQLLQKNEENLMSPRNIGICWSPTLFHQGNEAEDLIIFMIENHEKIFGKLDINNMTKVNVKSFNHNKVNSIVQKQKTIKRQSDMPRRNSTISLLEGKQLSDKENEKIMVRTRFLSRTKTLSQKNNEPIPDKDKVKKKKSLSQKVMVLNWKNQKQNQNQKRYLTLIYL